MNINEAIQLAYNAETHGPAQKALIILANEVCRLRAQKAAIDNIREQVVQKMEDHERMEFLEKSLYTLFASGLRRNEHPFVEIATIGGRYEGMSVRGAIDLARKPKVQQP